MGALVQDKDRMLNITGKLSSKENSRGDFYISKLEILSEKKQSKSRFPECSVCGQVKSKVLMMSCQHPICIVCSVQQNKEPKDIKCNDCNTYMHLLYKFHYCMAEVPQINLKSEADKIIEEENKQGKGISAHMKNKVERFNKFDVVADEVTKVERG